MWQCSNCNESVEDTFDICWNCGAAADGTPEAERGPDHRESDSASLASSSDHMNRRELAALICKTLALILFAVAAVFSVTAVPLLFFMLITAPYGLPDSQGLFVFFAAAVPVLAIVCVGILYWKKSEWIASHMVAADSRRVAIQPFTLHDAMIVAFSTAGLVFFFDGVRNVIAIIYIAREFSTAASEFWYDSQTWSAITQLALALWLILGSRGIVAVIHRMRTAGIPQDDDEPEDEHAGSP